MAAVTFMSEDHLLCCICLEVFTDPVSTPCGHNFCKSCITKHWNLTELCQCPMCKEVFSSRPQLRVNTLVSEMVSQFRNRPQQGSVSSEPLSAADVLCDVCSEPKHKALKSCLVCLLSYCPLHLEPHETVARLKKHQLTEPVKNLEEGMCPKHDKPLELFCKREDVCVCMLCTVLEHKNHDIVPLEEEYDEQRVTLPSTLDLFQHMMEQRRLKVQDIRHCLEQSQKQAHRQMSEGLSFYKSLMNTVQWSMEQFKQELQQKQKSSEEEAEECITDMEMGISVLENRSNEITQLQNSEDHLLFLQKFIPLKTGVDYEDWTLAHFEPPSFEGSLNRSVDQLQVKLNEEFKKLTTKDALRKLQQWTVDVTLDPNTAHAQLVLSKDLKQVYHDGVKKTLPYNPDRFTNALSVLGKQSFSSGRFYFEVQVKGKTRWEIGLTEQSVKRQSRILLEPQNGFWTIVLKDDKYKACAGPDIIVILKPAPERIGVYVDYEQGLVSFYDVDTALIYSFTGCTFNEKIYPYFNPGNNDKGKNLAPMCL